MGGLGGNGSAYGMNATKIIGMNNYGVVLQQVFSKDYIRSVVSRQIFDNLGKDIAQTLFLDAMGRMADIQGLQRFLGVEDDGIIGTNTRKAVESLQRVLGVEADGIYGPKTEAALLEAVRFNNL